MQAGTRATPVAEPGLKMRHCVFLRRDPVTWGGCERMLMSMLEKVSYTTHQITLMTASPELFAAHVRSAGVPVTVAPFPADYGGSFRRRYRSLRRALENVGASSAIFVQGTFLDFGLPDFLGAYVATRGRIFAYEVLAAPEPPAKSSSKHFGIVPGLGLWWYGQRAMCAVSGRLFTRVVTVGAEIERRLVEWYHYPRRAVTTVRHGTDLRVFSPEESSRRRMRDQYEIAADEIVIISTARLSVVKCVDRLVNAFDAVCGARRCRLLLLGDGPLRDDLVALAASKRHAGRIMFLGLRDTVVDFLRMSDVFVLPSENEGLSNAMMEAMATGLVCVVTQTPGAAEVIDEGRTGFIVERSEDGVRQGLLKAMSLSAEGRAQMGARAREAIAARFDIEKGLLQEMRLLGISE